MKTNEGFCVGYNVQTAVDAESYLGRPGEQMVKNDNIPDSRVFLF